MLRIERFVEFRENCIDDALGWIYV